MQCLLNVIRPCNVPGILKPLISFYAYHLNNTVIRVFIIIGLANVYVIGPIYFIVQHLHCCKISTSRSDFILVSSER